MVTIRPEVIIAVVLTIIGLIASVALAWRVLTIEFRTRWGIFLRERRYHPERPARVYKIDKRRR